MSRAEHVAKHVEGVLRHPDGSVDIAAYARIAHRERAAAIASSARATIRMVRGIWSVIRARLAPAGNHPAPMGR